MTVLMRPLRPLLHRLLPALLLAAALAMAWPAQAQPQQVLLRHTVLAEDDPQDALARATTEFETSTDPVQRFWLLLAQARALNNLEDVAGSATRLEAAQAALRALPAADERMRNWLELELANGAIRRETAAQINARLVNLRELARRASDPQLSCELAAVDMWVLNDSRSLDEAWIAAEEVERCAAVNGLNYLVPYALAMMGNIVTHVPSEQRQGRSAVELLRRALAALGPSGVRFRRSILEWDLANAYQTEKDWDSALLHLRNALALSENLRDRAGIGAARLELARVYLQREEPRPALRELALAHEQLDGHDSGSRMMTLATLKLQALTQLQRPEVLAEIDAARRWDNEVQQPISRARLARAMAQAYASQQRWREAYAEAQRASDFDGKARALASDTQVLRLQARYDGVRRDAETAELRHREENARLALQAESARQRALLAAVALLLVVLAGAGGWLRVLAQRRRVLADLALKDDLTGAPNRRAVTAYAEAQFAQTRRLGIPMTVAMIDLDHFKRVNDQHGHAAGDAVLRAFAHAAEGVLRGQDRIGRWGGEEWLLVMPGTPQDELPRVFERLRRAFASALVPGMPDPHGCTFSMGAAQWAPGIESFDALVARADQHLYEAKQNGRNRLRLVA